MLCDDICLLCPYEEVIQFIKQALENVNPDKRVSTEFRFTVGQVKQLLVWLEDYKQLKSDYIELDNRLRTANTEIDRLQSVSSWIPCKERMPENAGKPGAFCAKHLIMTKFGITEGWFNPDFDCWFALVWFYTSRFLDEEISMERADVPKVCRLPKSCVTHWRCFPDSPHGGGTYEKD